jgi:hypothetical protein
MSEIFFDTPVTKTTVIEYNRFKIKNILVELNSSAKIVVLVFPITGSESSVICKTIDMSPEDYAIWGTDDNYIINFVKTNLATAL